MERNQDLKPAFTRGHAHWSDAVLSTDILALNCRVGARYQGSLDLLSHNSWWALVSGSCGGELFGLVEPSTHPAVDGLSSHRDLRNWEHLFSILGVCPLPPHKPDPMAGSSRHGPSDFSEFRGLHSFYEPLQRGVGRVSPLATDSDGQ